MALTQLRTDSVLSSFSAGYTSGVLSGSSQLSDLAILNLDSFIYILGNKLGLNSSFTSHWDESNINHATLTSFNFLNEVDWSPTDFWELKGSPIKPPINSKNIKTSLYLVPQDSSYTAGYSAIAIRIHSNMYKLTGGRNFISSDSIFQIKDYRLRTKICSQLEVSTVRVKQDPTTGSLAYEVQSVDFLKASEQERASVTKLIYLFLATYHGVNDVEQSADILCSELASLMYQDVVVPFNSDYRTSIKDEIKYKWLKPLLML